MVIFTCPSQGYWLSCFRSSFDPSSRLVSSWLLANCEPSRFIEELPQDDLAWQGGDANDEQANEERGQETLAGLMSMFS